MNINEKISQEAILKMRNEIDLAGGNEVFFRGVVDEELVVTDVEVLARGNDKSVPAILRLMKKKEVIIHNHPSGYLYPSDADVQVASIYANKKQGASYIINNNVDDIYIIVELKNEQLKPIDIKPYFEEKGLLSQIFDEFEYRHEQLEMASVIEKGLNSEKKVIVEAGTGTGKTLAYLIPAIEWAVQNEKKVIVSTNTINLQEQLLNKDIPIVSKVIQGEFKYALVKGRGNFACLRKYHNFTKGDMVDLSEFSSNQKSQISMLTEWLRKTETGDKAELPFEPDNRIWEYFQSESDMCNVNACPHKGACFFFKSRQEKEDADLLITNHHMYFADLAIRKEVGFQTDFAILPNYDLVVFDEAHNIEKVARDYFSYEVSKYSFTKTMNNIYRITGGKSKKVGILATLSVYLKTRVREYEKKKSFIKDELIERHNEVANKAADYFLKIMEIYTKNTSLNLRLRKEKLDEDENWQEHIKVREEELFRTYNSYMRKLRELIRELKDTDDEDGIINDFRRYVDRLESLFMNFKFITDMEDEEYIYWLSANPRSGNIKLVGTPLKITDELQNTLYINLEHIVFTSATIAVDKNFDYFKKSIGLIEETLEDIIHSPFDYNRQMKVYIPRNAPQPNNIDFMDGVQTFIKSLIRKAGGNTFILFTSYSALNYLYYLIRDELEAEGFEMFIQGMAPRNQLINMYKTSRRPVLFGTDSFWEGVDVKGEKLSSVIMVKLPFKVPSDPVVEAIIENMTKEGKNAFMEYQIPESVIKFKQGIGRLIRSKEDKGIITILDARLITKRYGRIFIDAIPSKNIHYKTMEEIAD